MPVFAKDDKFILFIHVPKTGGSFVENFFHLNGYAMAYLDRGLREPRFNQVRRVSPQHMHAAMILQEFEMDKFDHIFMAVRHPVKRLLSEYRMRLDPENPVDFNDWFDEIFEEYQINPCVSDNHIRPQWEFVVNGARIFRQEDKFDAAWAATMEKEFGLKFEKKQFGLSESSHAKKPFAKGTDAITQENKDRIMALYEKDFAFFGYKPRF